jgi:hypothetical protein
MSDRAPLPTPRRKEAAGPFAPFGKPPPPSWDERLKVVVSNICGAAVSVVLVTGVAVAVVLLLVKLSMWAVR